MIERLVDLWRRYFVANDARILRIELSGWSPFRPALFRLANARRVYFLGLVITFRAPYSRRWAFDGAQWVPAYMLQTQRVA